MKKDKKFWMMFGHIVLTATDMPRRDKAGTTKLISMINRCFYHKCYKWITRVLKSIPCIAM
jgi:hypothetical protein